MCAPLCSNTHRFSSHKKKKKTSGPCWSRSQRQWCRRPQPDPAEPQCETLGLDGGPSCPGAWTGGLAGEGRAGLGWLGTLSAGHSRQRRWGRSGSMRSANMWMAKEEIGLSQAEMHSMNSAISSRALQLVFLSDEHFKAQPWPRTLKKALLIHLLRRYRSCNLVDKWTSDI